MLDALQVVLLEDCNEIQTFHVIKSDASSEIGIRVVQVNLVKPNFSPAIMCVTWHDIDGSVHIEIDWQQVSTVTV